MTVRSRTNVHPSVRRSVRLGLVTLTVLGATALAACAGLPGSSAPSPSAAASSPAASAGTDGAFDATDVTFAQMMVPHHQQAVQMSDMLLAKQGVDADVAKIAMRIKAEQQPEITTMQGWLSSWGQPSAGGMAMGSGGEMSQSEMDALGQADGPIGQKLYLQGMVKHHQGAVQMAQDEIANGRYPDAVALARSIVTSQQAEITTMNDLLTTL